MLSVLGQGNSRYEFDIHTLVLLRNISDIIVLPYSLLTCHLAGNEGRTGRNFLKYTLF
jgi:hypothetical protein